MPDTENLVLRRANWPDVDDIVALSADLEVMQHADGGGLPPSRVLAEEMPRLMAHNTRADQLGFWVARSRENGRFLGWFKVIPVEGVPATAELGCRLRRDSWDQGYGDEGISTMIDFARAAAVGRVVAIVPGEDRWSQQVLERAGLHQVDDECADDPSAAPEGASGGEGVPRRALRYERTL